MEKIGKYKIIEEIGKGGMGVVYKAYDPQIDRDVAIKIILDRALDVPEVKARFLREARTAGKLSHENITTIYEFGEFEGKTYIVMEYLGGRDLRSIIDDRKTLTLKEKLEYALQICRGLQYAHANEVIHRDIKPENIKILNNGRVKIIDFGIAKPTKSEKKGTDLTQVGIRVGTPRYMSPEQIKGSKIDQRSDIFSFGVLLYEFLTNKKPFEGDDTAVMYKIVYEEPEKINLKESGLVRELQAFLSLCLKKKVDARYQNCAELIAELTKILDKLDTLSPEKSIPQKKSSRPWLIAAIIFIIAGIAGGAWYFALFKKGIIGTVQPNVPSKDKLETAEINFSAQQATEIKQQTMELKAEADNAEAIKWAEETYNSGLENQKRGDMEFAGGNFETASQIYSDAADLFRKAKDEAQLAASQAEEDIEKLRDTITDQRRNMLNEKRAAIRAQSDKLATDLFSQAVSNEKSGDKEFSNATKAGLLAAQKYYANARDLFRRSREQTELVKGSRDAARVAKAEMDEAKSQVPGNTTNKQQSTNYTQGEKAELTGLEQLQAGDFQKAQSSFEQAQSFYRKAAQELLKLHRNIAEDAKAAMLSIKTKIDEEHKRTPAYREAQELEAQADASYSDNNLIAAIAAYQKAMAAYDQVLTIIRQEDQFEQNAKQTFEEIRTKLQRSFINKDIKTLTTIMNLSKEDQKFWSTFFDGVENLNASVESRIVDINANNAMADFSIKFTYVDGRNRNQENNMRYSWTMQNENGSWNVTEIAVKN